MQVRTKDQTMTSVAIASATALELGETAKKIVRGAEHAATALRWTYGETSAVIPSIGPGALQALAGSLAAASNGIGVYHIYGDETTFGEGYNMQQVPKPQQGIYGRIAADIGEAYTLHT